MKKAFFLFCILLCALQALPQNRNAVVKALNNYVLYSNANIHALTASITSLERYNGLFNDYFRGKRQLGGEPYEKPKPSPFLDEDVFTIGEDNPDHLYSEALKGATILPAAVKSDLNKSMAAMFACSKKIVMLVDSMSDIFSGPLINVTYNPEVPPYSFLHEAKRQLELSKGHRDQLFTAIRNHYESACPLVAPKGDYILSVVPLTQGMALCQEMINDLRKNDTTRLARHVHLLDSMHAQLESSELALLKGIKPIGNSKHFPNKGNFHGFDLYAKYESLLDGFQSFVILGKKYLEGPADPSFFLGPWHELHQEYSSHFNSVTGLVYDYNEYVLLIGGGKMKIQSDATSSGYIYKGWGDGSSVLPVRTISFWMKETPRFDPVIR